MRIEDWDVLIAAVEQTSLNRASQALNLSQPALSRRLAKLENELDVRLFERRGKRLVLTPAGRLCYEHALEMRRLDAKFRQQLADLRGGRRRSLTIGASLTTLQSTLPDLIRMYTESFPHSEVKALTGKTHEIIAFVKERRVDLGLVATAIESPDLRCVPLFDDHLSFVLPIGHPLLAQAAASGIPLQALNGLPVVLFSRGTWYRVLVDELFDRYDITPDIRMEIDSFEAIIRIVPSCGLATLLPKSYLRQVVLDDNGLAAADIPELRQTTRTTSLVHLKSAPLEPDLLAWIGRVRQAFAARIADQAP